MFITICVPCIELYIIELNHIELYRIKIKYIELYRI